MMTDLASARSLEREASLSDCCLMTDEARQFLVPRVRKAVLTSRWIARRIETEVQTCRHEWRIERRSKRIAA